METVIDEISAAVRTLGLGKDSISLLPPEENHRVFTEVLNRFVKSGDRRWWWEDFRESGTSKSFEDGSGWKLISEIAPDPDTPVWFIVEEDQLPHYPVFRTSPRVASQILANCYAFEYYLVPESLEWLICETHHNDVIALGAQVEQRLAQCAP